MDSIKIDLLSQLVSDGNLKKQLSERLKPNVYQSIFHELKDKYVEQGWIVEKEFKSKIRVSKQKPFDVMFEDEVWCTLAKVGFTKMNLNRQLKFIAVR
jgi:DNA sulfur modification protein DndB